MKTSVIRLTLLILFLTVTSCKKESNDRFEIKEYSVSDCKSNSKGIGDPEYITLRTVDNNYLLFSHINSVFNCSPGQITVTPAIDAKTITLNENESLSLSDCICPYDINFKMGPLQYGSYILVLKRGGQFFREYDLEFTSSTDISITIER